MQKITFTENLAHNIALMQSVFEGDDTFIVREATGRNAAGRERISGRWSALRPP